MLENETSNRPVLVPVTAEESRTTPVMPTPAPLPDAVSEIDLLKIEIAQEKAQKFKAQVDALTLQLDVTSAQFEQSKRDLDIIVAKMSMKYKVKGEDAYDKITGKITRKTSVP